MKTYISGQSISLLSFPLIIMQDQHLKSEDSLTSLVTAVFEPYIAVLKAELTLISFRMMRKYKDVPQWWYATMFIIMIGVSLAVCLGYPTAMHWWAFFVSIIIAIVWFVPIGLIQGMTSIQIGLNVFT